MAHVIMKPVSLEDLADLRYLDDLFYSGEATGNPHVFDDEEQAVDYRDKNQLDGQVIELIISNNH